MAEPETAPPGGTDEVDRLISAWQRERPDLDLAPMQVLSRVTRLAHLLDDARQQAFADHGIVGWEFDVLAALRRAGKPYQLSPGQLVQETQVTSGTMTNRIGRLAQRGLVRRSANPYDGRGAVVTLLPEGREVVDGALAALVEAEHAILAGLGRDESDQLAQLLRRLSLHMETTDI